MSAFCFNRLLLSFQILHEEFSWKISYDFIFLAIFKSLLKSFGEVFSLFEIIMFIWSFDSFHFISQFYLFQKWQPSTPGEISHRNRIRDGTCQVSIFCTKPFNKIILLNPTWSELRTLWGIFVVGFLVESKRFE